MSFWRDVKRKMRKRIVVLNAVEAERALGIMQRRAQFEPMGEREFIERFRARVEEMRSA